MRLVFAGTPEVAVPSLRALLASSHEVVAVLTRPDARTGRGRGLAPSPVKQIALEERLEVLTPRRPSDPEFVERLRELAPDACPIVAYGGLIRADALGVPRLGWINLHFSLLPAWRGAAPVQRALIAGDTRTGASTFVLEEGLDTGPILDRLTEQVHPADTAGDVLERLSLSGAGLLVASLDALESGRARPRPQPIDGISLAPKLTVDDARVRWSDPARSIDARIRGCTPAPGAWTTFRGERVKLAPVQVIGAGAGPDAGTDLATDLGGDLTPGALRVDRREVLVGTSTSAVRLTRVQPPGKKPMNAADWARGLRLGADASFDETSTT